MQNEELERLGQRALERIYEVLDEADDDAHVTIEWFRGDPGPGSASVFHVNQDEAAVHLNQDAVEAWFQAMTAAEAGTLLDGVAFRAASSYLFQQPKDVWDELVALHIEAEAEILGPSFEPAFRAANNILEAHRLDEELLELLPTCTEQLEAVVRLDLGEHPDFDVFPRAAVMMGRLAAPQDLAQPTLKEFLVEFGQRNWRHLSNLISKYVSLEASDVDKMLALTDQLVETAFPEAVGLGWSDGADTWDLKGKIVAPDDWNGLEEFLTDAIGQFTGHAGSDYGEAILISPHEVPIDEQRVGIWAQGTEVHLDATSPLRYETMQTMVTAGWQEFENSRGSFHKEGEISDAAQLSKEVVQILSHDASPLAGHTIWARGPAANAAREAFVIEELDEEPES